MFKNGLLLFSLFLALPDFSLADNPQIRLCRIADGKFLSVQDRLIEPDKKSVYQNTWGLCQWQNAVLDSISLIWLLEGRSSLALKAYFASVNFYMRDAYLNPVDTNKSELEGHFCQSLGAEQISRKSKDGAEFVLCVFKDTSFISALSLKKGYLDSFNKGLDRGLAKMVLIREE